MSLPFPSMFTKRGHEILSMAKDKLKDIRSPVLTAIQLLYLTWSQVLAAGTSAHTTHAVLSPMPYFYKAI